jgi:hypothetical protein
MFQLQLDSGSRDLEGTIATIYEYKLPMNIGIDRDPGQQAT